jgi:O-antigen ligase
MNRVSSLPGQVPGQRRLHPSLKPIGWGIGALLAGLALGLALASSQWELAVTIVFMGAGVLIGIRYPRRGLLLALMLHPLLNFMFLNLRLSDGLPDISLTRVMIGLLIAVLFARALTGHHQVAQLTGIEWAMLLMLVGLGVAVWRTDATTAALQWVFDYFTAPFLIYYIARDTTTDANALQRILWAIAGVGALSAVYGVYTQLTGHILFIEGELTGPLWYSENLRIMRGLFDSPHAFGAVFTLAIPVQFYLMLRAPTQADRTLAAIMLAVTTLGLFFTYKRTAWIASLASLVVIQYYFPRFRRLLVAIILSVGLVSWLFADPIADSAVATERVGDGADTLNGRLELWETAWVYIQREPWLGYGLFASQNYTELRAIESHYLWILLDSGLLGFVPYVLLFVLLIRLILRLVRRVSVETGRGLVDRDLLGVLLGVLVGYLVSLSTVVMNNEYPHMLVFLMLGAVAGSQTNLLRETKTGASFAALSASGRV